jgi:branched-subunit amino acid transport protein
MSLWLTLLSMGLVTYTIRLSLIVLLERVTIPERVRRALRFVPLAVLSAIIFPELLLPAGHLDVSTGNPRLWAGLLAMAAAGLTRNVLLTIAVGMGALWILQAVLR